MMRLLIVSIICGLAAGVENRAITKVINLLKDMEAKMEAEADADIAIYKKMSCWCQTNDKGKTESIDATDNQINQLVGQIERLTGKIAEYAATIADLDDSIK